MILPRTTTMISTSGFRRALLEEGIFFFPLATKQCSISASHSEQDVDQTVRAAERALKAVLLSVVNTGA